MQTKEQYIRNLQPYMPLQPAAVTRLIEDCPHYQHLELRMALEALQVPIPSKALLEPRMTIAQLLGYCDPFTLDLLESEEDSFPHYEVKVNFMLVNFRVDYTTGDVPVPRLHRDPVMWIIKKPSGKLLITFEDCVPQDIEVDDSSDELQRIHAYKLI